MAEIILKDVSVSYGKKKVLANLSFTIRDGECCTLIGPSACGKTTLARAICGFNKLDSGEITVGEKLVSSKPRNICLAPEQRSIGVVFQDYAVWPHMTVFENVYYPLKMRRISKPEALAKAQTALEQVKMWEYRDRLPAQLSGGQQQRVAIARALVVSGEIIIFDEPITNLDANLREEMRFEIKELQRRTGITVLYITQDQSDAMAISDQIVIMDAQGQIRQIGAPEQIFNQPADSFVYQFLGTANFIPLSRDGSHYSLKTEQGQVRLHVDIPDAMQDADNLFMASRPMDIELKKSGTLTGRIKNTVFLGSIYEYRVLCGGLELRVQQAAYEARQDGLFQPGEMCALDFANLHFFDRIDPA
jgi:iron(III) transport system ATP-binding protein